MDPTLYKAAVEGNVQLMKTDVEVGCQVTPLGNTILHLAALYGHFDLAREVLTVSPALLCRQNKKNETALHVAAKEGRTEVVRLLLSGAIGEAKETLMRMTDDNGDTTLHKAVRKQHVDVVRVLVKEDPECEFPANKAGETPLYLAAESGFYDALVEILESCKTPTYAGPCHRTALHAAIIHRREGCAKLLWQWNRSLCEEADKWGWNSLHYAVKQGLKEIVSDMLSWKTSLGYCPAGSEDDWTTIFHIAAHELGCVLMMKEIIKHCPDCWEMLNSSGRNALHVAILNNNKRVVKFLLNSPGYSNLIDATDEDGNTPLHLLAASGYYIRELINHPRAKKMEFNKENQTPLDLAVSSAITGWPENKGSLLKNLLRFGQFGRRDFEIKREEKRMPMTENETETRWENYKGRIDNYMKVAQTHLVVATLIAAVTFTAGLTLPGGFDNNPGPNQGMALLIRKVAFKAFVVTNAISFVCSSGAVFSYIAMAAIDAFAKNLAAITLLYRLSTFWLFFALAAVMLAFVTGTYATLAHSTTTLAIVVSALSSIYFFMLFVHMSAMKYGL